jgi:hypothetical protein
MWRRRISRLYLADDGLHLAQMSAKDRRIETWPCQCGGMCAQFFGAAKPGVPIHLLIKGAAKLMAQVEHPVKSPGAHLR